MSTLESWLDYNWRQSLYTPYFNCYIVCLFIEDDFEFPTDGVSKVFNFIDT